MESSTKIGRLPPDIDRLDRTLTASSSSTGAASHAKAAVLVRGENVARRAEMQTRCARRMPPLASRKRYQNSLSAPTNARTTKKVDCPPFIRR